CFDMVVNGAAAGALTGSAASYAGDVNGDGSSDLLIGAPGASSGAGAAYMVFGFGPFDPRLFPLQATVDCSGPRTINLASLSGSDGFVMDGAAGDQAGYAVSGAGDVNGDGVDDMVVGAPTDPLSPSGAGRAFVVFGSTAPFQASVDLSLLDGSTGFAFNGASLGDRTGISVGAADLNGDGRSDVIVGADRADPAGRGDEGAAYVVRGAPGFPAALGPASLNGLNGFVIAGAAVGDNAGGQVANAGDVNGDGTDDLLVAASLADPAGQADAGSVNVVYGTGAGFGSLVDLAFLDGTSGFYVNGAAAGDFSGSVGVAGDFNGDGFDDIHVGASQAAGGAGRGYTVFGYDFRRVAASVGGPASAGAVGDILIGSAGSELLADNALGDAVLKGGAGDDTLQISPQGPLAGPVRLAHGGGGFDQLFVNTNTLFDFAAQNQASHYRRYRELESMFLPAGASLRVTTRDLLRTTGGGSLGFSGGPSLLVNGDTGGATLPVVLSDEAWLLEGYGDLTGIAHYRNGHAHLGVQEGLDRSGIPVAFHWEAQTVGGNGFSSKPVLSGSGQFVVFQSFADNFGPTVPGGVSQIYMRDLKFGTVT
ncbi:MAG: hypothetical protein ACREE7_07830, partial [Dongiaceae bacterium]